MSCPICFEPFNTKKEVEPSCGSNVTHPACTIIITLEASCSHQFCGSCLEMFLQTCESHGVSAPSCPSCRQFISKEEMAIILGREYKPAGSDNIINHYTNNNQDIDEFTRTLLQELGVRQCGNCGAQILREEGCRAMQCICGFRFCIECAQPLDQCQCEDGRGLRNFNFFDNVTGIEEYHGNTPPPVAEADEIDNLRDFMDRTRVRAEQAMLERSRKLAIANERRRKCHRRIVELFCTACMAGDINRVQGMMRDKGQYIVTYMKYFDRSPLYYAARNGQTEVVAHLLHARASDDDGSCLFVASNDECRDMLKKSRNNPRRNMRRFSLEISLSDY